MLPDDSFISRVEVVPNHSTGHELMAFIRSTGAVATRSTFGELSAIPEAGALFMNFGIKYFISYGHRINDLLTNCQLAVDLIEPQPYQLSTPPFAIAARPWSGIRTASHACAVARYHARSLA